jgi:hypothetical protein
MRDSNVVILITINYILQKQMPHFANEQTVYCGHHIILRLSASLRECVSIIIVNQSKREGSTLDPQ